MIIEVHLSSDRRLRKVRWKSKTEERLQGGEPIRATKAGVAVSLYFLEMKLWLMAHNSLIYGFKFKGPRKGAPVQSIGDNIRLNDAGWIRNVFGAFTNRIFPDAENRDGENRNQSERVIGFEIDNDENYHVEIYLEEKQLSTAEEIIWLRDDLLKQGDWEPGIQKWTSIEDFFSWKQEQSIELGIPEIDLNRKEMENVLFEEIPFPLLRDVPSDAQSLRSSIEIKAKKSASTISFSEDWESVVIFGGDRRGRNELIRDIVAKAREKGFNVGYQSLQHLRGESLALYLRELQNHVNGQSLLVVLEDAPVDLLSYVRDCRFSAGEVKFCIVGKKFHDADIPLLRKPIQLEVTKSRRSFLSLLNSEAKRMGLKKAFESESAQFESWFCVEETLWDLLPMLIQSHRSQIRNSDLNFDIDRFKRYFRRRHYSKLTAQAQRGFLVVLSLEILGFKTPTQFLTDSALKELVKLDYLQLASFGRKETKRDVCFPNGAYRTAFELSDFEELSYAEVLVPVLRSNRTLSVQVADMLLFIGREEDARKVIQSVMDGENALKEICVKLSNILRLFKVLDDLSWDHEVLDSKVWKARKLMLSQFFTVGDVWNSFELMIIVQKCCPRTFKFFESEIAPHLESEACRYQIQNWTLEDKWLIVGASHRILGRTIGEAFSNAVRIKPIEAALDHAFVRDRFASLFRVKTTWLREGNFDYAQSWTRWGNLEVNLQRLEGFWLRKDLERWVDDLRVFLEYGNLHFANRFFQVIQKSANRVVVMRIFKDGVESTQLLFLRLIIEKCSKDFVEDLLVIASGVDRTSVAKVRKSLRELVIPDGITRVYIPGYAEVLTTE